MTTKEQQDKQKLALELLGYILEVNQFEDNKHKTANPIDKNSTSWNVAQLQNLKELLKEIFK
jgi:hypothetical protein